MKRPLALALTIAIFAAIAVCFLRPADPNPDFGYVPDVVLLGKKRSVTDCTGDTDVVLTASISSGYASDGYAVYLEAVDSSKVYAHTASMYKDGELLQEFENDIIEREVAGNREVIARSISDTYGFLIITPFRIWSESCVKVVYFPNWYEPGRYIITLHMRESVGKPDDGTTGEELYSITHTLATIPEESGKPFDLVSIFSDNALMELSDGGYHSGFLLSLRGGALYPIDSKIEVSKAGKWAEFESPDGAMPEKPSVDHLDTEEGINQIHFSFNHNDPTADYRATITFAANPDGSGEQYTLTLRLRFGEVPARG